MRFIAVLGFMIVFSTLTAQAQELSSEITQTAPTYLDTQNGGISCGITNGEYKKALYKEPEQQTFIINVSAYTAAADECGKSDGITASGKKVQGNQTLACPKEYTFGTKIHIKGMGTYICEDRGGAIKGNKFDIYMETKKEAFSFGRQKLEAHVVI